VSVQTSTTPAAPSGGAAPRAGVSLPTSLGASTGTGSTDRLLNLIGNVESRGNYNILVGGRTEPSLTNMTIAEVLEFQSGMPGRGHESTAVGKYQIIRGTLQDLVKSGAVSMNDVFSPATQDRLAITLLNRRGYQRYLQGNMSVDQFADRVAMEWASFPMPDGRSFYAGVGSNKALVDRSTVVATLQGYRFGGIAQGPDSGYMVELHGTEAVVPLPDGQSIPVEMPNYANSIMMQTEALTEQTQRLNQLISVMRTRNQISQKILRAYQS
jgi:muramidase (phage lysozyme)